MRLPSFDYLFHVFIPKHLKKGAVMMYKTIFSAVGITVIAAFFCVGCGGGGGSRPSELVGQWEHASGATYRKPENMELFKDGTGVVDGGTISWKVENKRLILLSSLDGLACNYKVSGYELALDYDDGGSAIFVRVGKLEEFEAQQAIDKYSQTIKRDPNDANAYYDRGNAYFDNNEYDKAIADYTEAIRLDPKYGDYYTERGDAYQYGKKNYDKAIADYTEAIQLNPENLYAYNNRGSAYCERKDYGRAIADHTKAIELDPNNAIFYNSRCWTYGNKREYDKAIADCNQAIQLDPEDANIYHSRGFAYLGKKDYDKAIADFEVALRLDPDLQEAKDDLKKAKKLKGSR